MRHQLGPIPRLHQPAIRHFLWSRDSQFIVMSHGPSLWLCNAHFQFIRHLVEIEYDEYGLPRNWLRGEFIDDIIPVAWTPDNQAVIVREGWCIDDNHDWPTHWFVKRIAMDGSTPPRTIAEYQNVSEYDLTVQPNRDTSQLLVGVQLGTWANPSTQFRILDTAVAFEYPYHVFGAEWMVEDQYILTQSWYKWLGYEDGQAHKPIIEYPNHIRLWDATTGQVRFDFPPRSDYDKVFISPDKMLACIISLDATAWVWDLATCEILFGLEGFTDPIPHTFAQAYLERVPSSKANLEVVQWSPDLKRLAGLRGDNIFFIWDAANGIQISQFQPPTHILGWCWSFDGCFLVTTASPCDDVVTLYEVPSGERVDDLVGYQLIDACLDSFLWRPDGQQMAVTADSATLKIWNTPTSGQWTLVLDYYPAGDA